MNRVFQYNSSMKSPQLMDGRMDKESPWSSFETPQDTLTSPWSSFEESTSTDALKDMARRPSPREGRRGSFFDMHQGSDASSLPASHQAKAAQQVASPGRVPHIGFHPHGVPLPERQETEMRGPVPQCWQPPATNFVHGHPLTPAYPRHPQHSPPPPPHQQQQSWVYTNPASPPPYAYNGHDQSRKWNAYPTAPPASPSPAGYYAEHHGYPNYNERYAGAPPPPAVPFQGAPYRPEDYYQHRPYPYPETHPPVATHRADWCHTGYPVQEYPPQPPLPSRQHQHPEYPSKHPEYSIQTANSDRVYILNPYSFAGPRGEGLVPYGDVPVGDIAAQQSRPLHGAPAETAIEQAIVTGNDVPKATERSCPTAEKAEGQSQSRRRGKRSKKAKKLPQVDTTDKRYKTVRCSHWNKRGRCPFGAHCMFAHGAEDLNVAPRAPKEPRNIEADPNTGIFMKLVSEAYGVTLPDEWGNRADSVPASDSDSGSDEE